MIIPDRKKLATVILAKMGGDKGDSTQDVKPEADLDESMEGLKSAAEDMLQAIADKSPHELAMALKAFIEQCNGMEEDVGE